MLNEFFKKVDSLLVLVSTLLPEDQASVLDFLCRLNAPVYLEALSGVREAPNIQHLRLLRPEKILSKTRCGVLRIGGVPTTGFWRLLEESEGKVEVLSVSHLPFRGLSWGKLIHTEICEYFKSLSLCKTYPKVGNVDEDRLWEIALKDLLSRRMRSEPALVSALSGLIPKNSTIYLGNSLPIRHWDLAAGLKPFEIHASRGLNGIDGQISTFLGICEPERENWGIFGDLTAIYDLAAPWIIDQLKSCKIAIIVINNGGGKIFERMYSSKSYQNLHNLCFESLAKFWNLHYERWELIPNAFSLKRPTLIEIVPDLEETTLFWKEFSV